MRMQELKTKMIGMMVRHLITTNTEKRDRLIPSVSPNKTVEGAAGGLLFAVILFVLVGVWVPMPIHYPKMIIYCILASVVGQFGDLCMSCVKRICGVKDFGKIFPGHGGMLDRFDSQLLTIRFLYYSFILRVVSSCKT